MVRILALMGKAGRVVLVVEAEVSRERISATRRGLTPKPAHVFSTKGQRMVARTSSHQKTMKQQSSIAAYRFKMKVGMGRKRRRPTRAKPDSTLTLHRAVPSAKLHGETDNKKKTTRISAETMA